MSGENCGLSMWAEYVEQRVDQHVKDSLRDEYLLVFTLWKKSGIIIEDALIMLKDILAGYCAIVPSPTEAAKDEVSFLLESWLWEGYELHEKGET